MSDDENIDHSEPTMEAPASDGEGTGAVSVPISEFTGMCRSIEEHLKCTICYRVFSSPYVLSCGHIFCKACIEKWVESRPECPLCKRTLKTTLRDGSILPAVTQLISTTAGLGYSISPIGSQGSQPPLFMLPTHESQEGDPSGSSIDSSTQVLVSSSSMKRPRSKSLLSSPLGEQRNDTAMQSLDNSLSASSTPLMHSIQHHMWVSGVWHYTVSLHPPSSQDEDYLLFKGPCGLCGLSVDDEAQTEALRQQLARRSRWTGCSGSEATGLGAVQWDTLTGPMWGLECRREGSTEDRPCAVVSLLAHQNCLVWKGLLPAALYASDTLGSPGAVLAWVRKQWELLKSERLEEHAKEGVCASAMALGESMWERQDSSRASMHCYLCGRASIGTSNAVEGGKSLAAPSVPPSAGLRPCQECGVRKYAHFLCALLASSAHCVVYGLDSTGEPIEMWCGSCHRRRA